VVDFKAPSSLKAIEALREGGTRAILLGYCGWYSPSEASAEDLLQEAMLVVCDPRNGRPWDEARGSFITHVRTVIRDLAHDTRRTGYGRYVVLNPAAADLTPSDGPSADDTLSTAEASARLHRMGARVRERLAPDEIGLAVFDLACDGVDRPADVAARLGCKVEDVYRANDRIAYHAGKVLARERESERARVNPPRDGATTKRDPRP
jgi:DNA-directed RNA polymerase specialized sigma24 family protein